MILVASPTSSSSYGDFVTFFAIIAGGSSSGSGTVTFYDGTVDQGRILALNIPFNSGVASPSPISSLSVGTHTITAAYSGDTTSASATAKISFVVNKVRDRRR